MKKIYWLFFLTFILSCKKEYSDKIGFTNEDRKQMLEKAVREKQNSDTYGRGQINVKDTEKTRIRVEFSEHKLFSADDIRNGLHLQEIVAVNQEMQFTSFGYILVNSEQEVTSSTGAFSFKRDGQGGIWHGYLLYSDGCYHHGTFVYLGNDPFDYWIFVPDRQEQIGFEDICLTDEEWEVMC